MSFYVTLPSGLSKELYPNNTQSDYTTLLRSPLILNQNYEVALTELTCSSDVLMDLGTITFINPFSFVPVRELRLTINIEAFNGEYTDEFINNFNSKLDFLIVNTELEFRNNISKEKKALGDLFNFYYKKAFEFNRHYYNIPVFKEEIKKDIFKYFIIDIKDSEYAKFFLKNLNYTFDQGLYYFDDITKLNKELNNKEELTYREIYIPSTYSESNAKTLEEIKKKLNAFKSDYTLPTLSFKIDKLYLDCSHELNISMTGHISELFLNHETNSYNRSVPFSKYVNFMNYFAVYTNIIESQYIGDTMAPILRLVNISKNSNKIATQYQTPHYVRVNKNTINTINISIRDMRGLPVRFHNIFSYVIIKLHFRKISNE